ncbi:MAG: prefoldin subunit alpha [Candidatus Thermoplasmatota archaeon]|jgi:prefoldin alpha subunit|nr:prefoldin subunit alpha [Candidatus Thermoplasmatota archaeon]
MPEPSEEPMDATEAVQNDLARLETYKSQLNVLLRQQEILRLTLQEHTRARDTLEGIERLGADPETLAPVGADTYVKVSQLSTQKVLMGIGSGVVVEVDREKGLAMLNDRIVNLERSSKEMGEELLRVDSEAQIISQRLESLVRQQQAAQGGFPDQ